METHDSRRRPTRLTYLITDLQVGGVPLHLYRLATGMAAARYDVRVIALADPGPVGAMLKRAGVPVDACEARSPRDVRTLTRLYGYLRRSRPDVLHALLFHANVAARLVGPAAGVPVSRIICEIQTVERVRGWHLALDNLTCRLCRFEVGNSPSVLEHLARHAHIPRSRLRCVWGAVDADRFATARPLDRHTLGVRADERLIVWAGRLDPVKGFEEMIGAVARVARRWLIRFVLAGEGAYRPQIEALIRAHSLDERVALLGNRPDVPNLLATADVFLFGSRTEGLPNALLEAMAAGLPVVVTDVAGNRDLVAHEQTGLLVAAGSAESLAGGLERVLERPGWAGTLGRQAQKWVIENFDASSFVPRWEHVYSSLIETPDAERGCLKASNEARWGAARTAGGGLMEEGMAHGAGGPFKGR